MKRFLSIVLLAMIAVSLCIMGFLVYRTKNLDTALTERHQTSEFFQQDDEFAYPDNFKQYITNYQRAILNAPRTAQQYNDAQLLLKSPLLLDSSTNRLDGSVSTCGARKQGILLIHGLSDSPYSMYHLADYFDRQCFVVLSIVLPGHAIQPGDLKSVSYKDWMKAVQYGVDQLKQRVDEYHVAGLSLGAGLALANKEILDTATALWLFVPALKIDSQARFLAVTPFFDWVHPKAPWFSLFPDVDPFKYESFPLNAISQVYHMTDIVRQVTRRKPNDSTWPALHVVASKQDSTVDYSAIIKLFDAWNNPQKSMLLFDKSTNNKTEEAVNAQLRKIPKLNMLALKDSGKVLSLSHTSLMVPSSDPFYGKLPMYRDCRYYYRKSDNKYNQCKSGGADYFGENTQENLNKGVIERLRYNPFWDEMLASIDSFRVQLENKP